MLEKLEVFLREALGQKYGLGRKLFRKKSNANEIGTYRQIIAEDRTFFCSELVAKAFKFLGVI